jgi:hypothetical protein
MALEPAAALKDTDLTEVNAPSPLVTAAAAPAAATAADTPAPVDAALTVAAGAPAAPADPWAALLEAGAALLQGLAVNRGGGDLGHAMPAIKIERDPQTGQASVRLPLPDPAVLQKLAKAFEPWLR